MNKRDISWSLVFLTMLIGCSSATFSGNSRLAQKTQPTHATHPGTHIESDAGKDPDASPPHGQSSPQSHSDSSGAATAAVAAAGSSPKVEEETGIVNIVAPDRPAASNDCPGVYFSAPAAIKAPYDAGKVPQGAKPVTTIDDILDTNVGGTLMGPAGAVAFVLQNDLDLGGMKSPIQAVSGVVALFGAGHKISNLGSSLFGNVVGEVIVADLTIENATANADTYYAPLEPGVLISKIDGCLLARNLTVDHATVSIPQYGEGGILAANATGAVLSGMHVTASDVSGTDPSTIGTLFGSANGIYLLNDMSISVTLNGAASDRLYGAGDFSDRQ